MAYAPYEFLFTDQNPNREFVVQPYTTNGPSSPDGGVDPAAANANTTLYLYGRGSPNYGDRIQENLVYMLEHFFSPTEPSFPIPGQLWCKSSSNELTTPFQMFMFNPRQITITASSANQLYVVSDDGSLTQAQILQRFQALGLAKSFNVYDSAYNQLSFIQSALPIVSGPSNVLLTVTPTVLSSLTGQFIGGWEEIYQGNAEIVLRRPFNANTNNIINLASPVNPGDAANKAYVDSAVTGGSISLAGLSDVSITAPITGQILEFNGLVWVNSSLTSSFLPLAGGTMSGIINMNGSSISNLSSPINIFDATNKQYVDQQPLSGANVTITTPTNGDLIFYDSSLFTWINGQPAIAGVVPIAGGITFTGPISMGNQSLTLVPTPVNPGDAANKAYVDAITLGNSGVVTNGTYDQNVGVLTLTLSGGFPQVFVSGFLPTPNGFVPASEVNFIPQNPSSLPQNPSNQFFPSVMSDATIVAPGDIQDPISMTLQAMLNQLDVALGNFIPPRQRLVIPMPGTTGHVDLNHGLGLPLAGSPGVTYVKGSENLAVYLNGIKQVASTSGYATITNFTIGGTYLATFTNPNMIIVGNVTRVLHPGVQFSVSGTGTSNDGNFIIATSTLVLGSTIITAIPNGYNANNTQISPFVTSGPGTVTYVVTNLRSDMETGYTVATPLTLQVTVNQLSPVTILINPSTTNISNLGLLRDVINTIALNHFINSITSASGLQFQVPGNVAYAFPTGTTFRVRYSNGNDGVYTVSGTGSTFAAGFTTINVTGSIPNTPSATGVIFQDNWGFAMSIENGNIIFRSNIPGNDPAQIALIYPGYNGSASFITVTDPEFGTGLFSGIVGITWPIKFNTPIMSTVGFVSAINITQPTGGTLTPGTYTNVPLLMPTAIGTLTQPTGGTITPGTYTGVSLTGGSGTGALATVVVAGVVVTSVTLTTPGTGYHFGNVLGYTGVGIGTGGTVTVTSGSGALATFVVGTPTGGPPPVINLASSITYGVIAATIVTTISTTTINGDLALTPGSSVTGSPVVTGATNIDNFTAVTAKSDAQAAYIVGQALTPFSTIAAELGSTSPIPGYYQFTGGAAQITTGPLTLNGTATDVWVFQIASTLTTAASSSVVLTGGAVAKNVYWMVGSNATLGASSTFIGTIIANTTINVGANALITGHLFALTGAVNLNQNTVTATSGGGAISVLTATITSSGTGFVVGNTLSYTGGGLGTGGTATVVGINNPIGPADYAYSEVGMNGYSSSLFIFNTPPVSIDVMEVVIDREMVYNANNPFAAATIQP